MSALTNAFGPPLATLIRGEGSYVWDADGNRYLDFLAGIAVNALGHAHPAMVEAVSSQIATLGHISNFFVSDPQLELAARLADLSDLGEGSRVFFSNSGAEANETAFKMVRLHGRNAEKSRVVALKGAFHGRTMGSLALTWNSAYREPFEPLPGGVTFIDPTPNALQSVLEEGDVAAVILEPIQGEAGVVPLPEGFLETARRLTFEHEALLVLDEIQTGVGRTGTWLAHHLDSPGLSPSAQKSESSHRADIVTLAKGLGGGMPIGATVAGPRAADLLYPGSHGSTFGGNPLACRAALAVIDTIESEGLLENAIRRGAQLRERISGLESPLVDRVTGTGLLLGIQLNQPVAKDLVARAFGGKLIVNAPRETTVRLAPPLIIGDVEVEEFANKLEAALGTLSQST